VFAIAAVRDMHLMRGLKMACPGFGFHGASLINALKYFTADTKIT
jgi:hypothetical protein